MQALRLQAAGRTDAGVHARGQVVSFHLPPGCRLGPQELRKAINANCPASLRVLEVARVPIDFSARHSSTNKFYRYELRPSPLAPSLQIAHTSAQGCAR